MENAFGSPAITKIVINSILIIIAYNFALHRTFFINNGIKRYFIWKNLVYERSIKKNDTIINDHESGKPNTFSRIITLPDPQNLKVKILLKNLQKTF